MEDWNVPDSDDETSTEVGFYVPSDTNVIIQLYEALQKGEIPSFQTTIFPRREPDVVKQETNSPEQTEEPAEKTPEKEKSQAEATEFDFDTQPEDNVKRFTPRRTPNKPITKKVGSLANVYSNIMKYKKMDEEQSKEKEPQAN